MCIETVEVDVDKPADGIEEETFERDVPVLVLEFGDVLDGDMPEETLGVEPEGDEFAEEEPEVEEFDGWAHAIAGLVNTAVPTPSATARPLMRPTHASLCMWPVYAFTESARRGNDKIRQPTSISLHCIIFAAVKQDVCANAHST